jgi:hypothetical protein
LIKRLLEKWFRLEPIPCPTCEVLREQLAHSEVERRELLHRLMAPPEPPPVVTPEEEPKAIQPQFVPWRVRQQMLEAEDRKSAQLMKDKTKEIEQLEKELGIAKELDRGKSGGLKAEVGGASKIR